ncbi:MAG TPA: hypothetical protein P5137_02180 [Candidatus Brocadiia bacterium]|nr:hypothetical protein [Candidatus Brocadiia bacterium]
MTDQRQPADAACVLSVLELYEHSARQTDALLDRMAAAPEEAIRRRPAPKALSAEEWVRHLLWSEDTLLRVENLELDAFTFPDNFSVLPGQVLETHCPLPLIRETALLLRKEVLAALSEMTADTLADEIDETEELTVRANFLRYLELAAGARACAAQALRMAALQPKP